MQAFLDGCAKSVLEGDADAAEKLAREALAKKYAPLDVIEKGFVKGIKEVGRLWEEGTLFLPELVMGAEAMKRAMAVLQPSLAKAGSRPKSLGHVVIGTIEGDIHDIGKTLVATMLSANGFEITDLGADVPAAKFVDEAAARGAGCIAISALLTTTMSGQKRVVDELKKRSLGGTVKVMVGGAPCSDEWAREIGADGYAGDAVAAVALAQSLMGARG
jgi:corrinoid protein of di/trimethylamine methyltransferase